ncbi:hypothetical protein RUM44_005904 [Polyplax serrata]|uniref:Uncharacterized protein n=1 Tax=Polyplax serrata TaxID=468196 RepID=A0ABR1AYD7_POLSC
MIPAPVTHFDETPDIYQGANTAKQKCQKNVGEEAATGLGPLAIAHVELVLANLIGDTQSDVEGDHAICQCPGNSLATYLDVGLRGARPRGYDPYLNPRMVPLIYQNGRWNPLRLHSLPPCRDRRVGLRGHTAL